MGTSLCMDIGFLVSEGAMAGSYGRCTLNFL